MFVELELLSNIQTKETEHLQKEKKCQLKMMSSPELLHVFTVDGEYFCYHISCVTSDRVWVKNGDALILANTAGKSFLRLEDKHYGIHTVNSDGELIYIDIDFNIKKLSKDMKTTTTLIEKKEPTWISQCVYWSSSTGDLLVGMYRKNQNTGKVTRYNQFGQLTQTIPDSNKSLEMYIEPHHITENSNGDVIVSDYDSTFEFGALIVTKRRGRHRFTYTGHPSSKGLKPNGICTDALLHILVCDLNTKTVQMLDKDGQFLSYLLIRPIGIFYPISLSYDVNTHNVMVGSLVNNKVCVFRYITGRHSLKGMKSFFISLG